METKNNEPENLSAFPQVRTTERLTPSTCGPNVHSVGGMTLRDYFAAKAMQAYVTTNYEDCALDDDKVSTWAYQLADAMLAARQKGAA